MDESKLLNVGDHFGDYVIDRLLGKGGMGAVYLIRQPESGAVFAAKIMIPPEGEEEHEFRRRFAREAEIAMKVNHRNLIKVYDVGEDPDTGLCYIIMDYVSGGSVTDRLRAHGRMEIEDALKVTVRVASALAKAHKAGVVHRDIKPDNIMFDADGTPKLADLGIAKLEDEEEESKTLLTGTGMVIGTPAYMAPEQMMDSHRVTAKADIYSLGMVLYEMLTGERPHGNSSVVELMAKVIRGEELKDIRELRPEVPDAVAKVIKSMCANNPEERPENAEEVMRLCRDAATYLTTGKQSLGARIKLWVRRLKYKKSTQTAIRTVLAAGVVVALMGIGFVLGNRDKFAETDEEPVKEMKVGRASEEAEIREMEGEKRRREKKVKLPEAAEEEAPKEETPEEEKKPELEGWNEKVTGDGTLAIKKDGKWVLVGNNNCVIDRGNFSITNEMRIAIPENARGMVKDPGKIKVRSVTFGTTMIPAGRDAKEVRVAESIAVGGRQCDRRVLVSRSNDAGCITGSNYTRTDGMARYEFDDLTLEIGKSYKLEVTPQENGHPGFIRFAAGVNTESGIVRGMEFYVPWKGKKYGPVVRIEIEEEEEPKAEPLAAESVNQAAVAEEPAKEPDQTSAETVRSPSPGAEPPVAEPNRNIPDADGEKGEEKAETHNDVGKEAEDVSAKVEAMFDDDGPAIWSGKSRLKNIRELPGGLSVWKELVNTAKARRRNPMRDWKQGCIVVGKLDMWGLQNNDKILSPACINPLNNTFAMAVHPEAGKIVFVVHGYAVKEIAVPESENKWQDGMVVDLGTVKMRKLTGGDRRSVAFKTPIMGGSNKVQVEMVVNVSNMCKWNLIPLNNRGSKTNTVKMEMQGEVWTGTFGGGVRNNITGCANCLYEVRIRNNRGRTVKKEADLTDARALELGNVSMPISVY